MLHSPYRIGLDLSALSPDFKEHALRGIGRYVFELDKYFRGHHSSNVSVLPFRHDEFAPPGPLDALISKLPYGRQTIRQQFIFPLRMSAKTKSRFDLLHFPAHMDAPSWSIRDYIITVLDLIPLVLPDLYKADKSTWKFHLARFLEIKAIRNAKHIIAISEHTAKDVNRILGIPTDRISVTPLGVDESFFKEANVNQREVVRKKYRIPLEARYILYVGGIDQRKNITVLINAFRRVVDHCRAAGTSIPRLVLVGQISSDKQYPRLRSLIQSEGVDDLVIETGFADDCDLQALYADAALFFFPSLYEGFGLPPLEAMASGTPVVSSNTSSLSEVLGEAAICVSPNDLDECTKSMISVLEDRSLADSLIRKGKLQAKKFTWSKTGEATLKVYEKMQYDRT